MAKYGRVDHAIANAGVIEQGNWFDKSLTIESVEQEPTILILDINLKGFLYFVRVAAAYMVQDIQATEDKSLTHTEFCGR
jgi:NAD(P)-dependent dehydrogenase (short-subunit alcohol dehydrogenase family)